MQHPPSILIYRICTLFLAAPSKVLKSIFECGGEPNTFSRLWLKPVQINKNQLLIHKAESCMHLGKVTLSPNQDHWKVTDNSKWGTCSFSQLYLTPPLHPSPSIRLKPVQAVNGAKCRHHLSCQTHSGVPVKA